MKHFLPLFLVAAATLTASAAQPSPQPTASLPGSKSGSAKPSTPDPTAAVAGKPTAPPAPKETSAPATQDQSPAQAAPPASLTLDAYVTALAGSVPLSKDEQTDVKTYYLDDGAKLQGILNDPSLSPLEQTQQVDALRDARNARIEALLGEPDRQAHFVQVERDYRVALLELAAQGGLVPGSPPPKVPEPTATTPAQAEKPTPGIRRVDAVPGT